MKRVPQLMFIFEWHGITIPSAIVGFNALEKFTIHIHDSTNSSLRLSSVLLYRLKLTLALYSSVLHVVTLIVGDYTNSGDYVFVFGKYVFL